MLKVLHRLLESLQPLLPFSRHSQSKAETYSIEGLNSLLRHYLARVKRTITCYSKPIEMMECSLKLLFNALSIEN